MSVEGDELNLKGESFLTAIKQDWDAITKRKKNDFLTQLSSFFVYQVLIGAVLVLITWYFDSIDGALLLPIYVGSQVGVLLAILFFKLRDLSPGTKVETYSWWDNITGSESSKTWGAIDYVLSKAESGAKLNHEEQVILNSLHKSVQEAIASGKYPTTYYQALGERILIANLLVADQLPTTK